MLWKVCVFLTHKIHKIVTHVIILERYMRLKVSSLMLLNACSAMRLYYTRDEMRDEQRSLGFRVLKNKQLEIMLRPIVTNRAMRQ